MANAPTMAKLRYLWQKRPRRLSPLRQPGLSVSQLRSMAHMINEPIEEELLPGDRLRYFHPTKPGEVLDGRFKTIAKLGHGAGSAVWLAENLRLYGFRIVPLFSPLA